MTLTIIETIGWVTATVTLILAVVGGVKYTAGLIAAARKAASDGDKAIYDRIEANRLEYENKLRELRADAEMKITSVRKEGEEKLKEYRAEQTALMERRDDVRNAERDQTLARINELVEKMPRPQDMARIDARMDSLDNAIREGFANLNVELRSIERGMKQAA